MVWLKERIKKFPIVDKNHGLTPFEKWKILQLSKFDVFIAKKGYFQIKNIP